MVESRLYDLIKHTDFDVLFKQKGYAYFKEGDYNLNIIGVRNLIDAKPSKSNPNILTNVQRDKFDDALVVTLKINGVWKRYVWALTTDPGLRLLKAPSNSNGTAILVPGQYRGVYKKDLHNGKYYAICQRLGPVKVYRDSNRDNTLDMNPAKIQTGYFGINIHRAAKTGVLELIGGHSAGCQVFQNTNEFNKFMEFVDKAIALYGNSFTYTLITSEDIRLPNK